jgi:hypothetical protein
VAVYSKGLQFYITYTKAARQLWFQRMYQHKLANEPYASPEPIKIIRIDASFPSSTAIAVRRAWTQMLRRTALHSGSPTVDQVVMDATDYQFSLMDGKTSRVGTSYGNGGKRTSELLKIGHLLIDYGEASDVRRKHVAEQIEGKANRLAFSFAVLSRK